LHFLVCLDFLGRAVGQDGTVVEDRDSVGEGEDYPHTVFDEHDRHIARELFEPLDEGRNLVDG